MASSLTLVSTMTIQEFAQLVGMDDIACPMEVVKTLKKLSSNMFHYVHGDTLVGKP